MNLRLHSLKGAKFLALYPEDGSKSPLEYKVKDEKELQQDGDREVNRKFGLWHFFFMLRSELSELEQGEYKGQNYDCDLDHLSH